jgi:hypothetical protein
VGRPYDPTDDQVWVREATGATPFLAAGHLATFSPGRTGVTIARHVTEGREPNSKNPEHDELTARSFDDNGQVFPMNPHRDGIVDWRVRHSHDGRSLWMLVADGSHGASTDALMRYDRTAGTTTTVLSLSTKDCTDFEILPSGANALLACGTQLLTVQLATGNVTHRTAMPSGVMASAIDGRLDTTTLLLSTQNTGPGAETQLAALDLTTMGTRTLPGTAGYAHAVAAY